MLVTDIEVRSRLTLTKASLLALLLLTPLALQAQGSSVAAFQNPQQAMYSLRETVLRNSLVKQNQQAVAAAVKRARGLYFPEVRNNLHRLMLLAVVVAGAND